jgi:ATP-dependent helicase/nuclease subunit A
LRSGVEALLNRRLVAPRMLLTFLNRAPRDLTAAGACRSASARLRDLFERVPCGLEAFLDDGPIARPQFAMLADDIRGLIHDDDMAGLDSREGQATFRALLDRLRAYFLTQEGKARGEKFTGTGFTASDCESMDSWRRHRTTAAQLAPAAAEAIRAFRRDLNAVMSRGVWRVFAVALGQYQRTLEAHALLDFSGVLERAVALLRDMDEFAESRLRLEARYRHVLVDEFQDTSRIQWELIVQLVKSWGEGHGASTDAIPPSIFVVGDRKQSIYGFRDADASIVDDAAAFIGGLRPNDRPGQARQAISVSFRSSPTLLSFLNDLFGEIVRTEGVVRQDGFRYDEHDRFPATKESGARGPGCEKGSEEPGGVGPQAVREESGAKNAESVVGILTGESLRSEAECVASEIARLLSDSTVRDRATGISRKARPSDVAILCRSRDGHRELEAALDRRSIPTYVYKGLGFFDADEVQDAVALLRFLADPTSDLRAATFLRSRLIRLSDDGLARLGPDLAASVTGSTPDTLACEAFEAREDHRVLEIVREAVPRWLALVDRLTPSELLDQVLAESAYAFELRGSRRPQARENLKKLRAMVRRAQNRGYATLGRIADHLDQLALGDEANAAIDALEAVNLMTVHAAKGLEFPIVFIVNMGRGTGNARAPIRVGTDPSGQPSVAIADYQSESDEDMQARDREETKRLLYVATTRARDRLYLSSTVQNGMCRMGRGSLGEVLPAAIKALFPAAAMQASADGDGCLEWLGASGTTHVLRARTASTSTVQPIAVPEPPPPRGSLQRR